MKLNEENLAKQSQLNSSQKIREKTEKQRESSEQPSATKKSGSASATLTSGRGTKRGRESVGPNSGSNHHHTGSMAATADNEDEWQKRPEIKISIPQILKVQLVDDWEAVTKNSQVCYDSCLCVA